MDEELFSYAEVVAHGGAQHDPADLDADFAGVVADTMQALAAPSRVRILGRLHRGPCSVNELAGAVGMESSAVSHQLRLLRHLGLVVGRRHRRRNLDRQYRININQPTRLGLISYCGLCV